MSQESEVKTEEAKQEELNLNSIFLKKVGMTRIFDTNGNHVPVTVLEIADNFVSQVKTSDRDGYSAYKVAFNSKREKLISSPRKGELRKSGIEAKYYSQAEVRVESDEELKADVLASKVSFSLFTEGAVVNVTGITKGKGFAGVVKKFGFAGGPMSHGSKFHRTTGSIGNRATPGKVWKGKKMPGHLGAKKQTVKNLTIAELNLDKGYLLIKGSVPGAKNSYVRVTKVKK